MSVKNSTAAMLAAKKRQRREARIRENYDRISAALINTDSTRFAARHPARVIPEVPGIFGLTKNETKKDTKDIDHDQLFSCQNDIFANDEAYTKIQRSYRPPPGEDSTLLKKHQRLISWINNPALQSKELTYWLERRDKMKLKLLQLEEEQNEWYHGIEKSRHTMLYLLQHVQEYNTKLSTLITDQVGKCKAIAQPSLSIATPMVEEVINSTNTETLSQDSTGSTSAVMKDCLQQLQAQEEEYQTRVQELLSFATQYGTTITMSADELADTPPSSSGTAAVQVKQEATSSDASIQEVLSIYNKLQEDALYQVQQRTHIEPFFPKPIVQEKGGKSTTITLPPLRTIKQRDQAPLLEQTLHKFLSQPVVPAVKQEKEGVKQEDDTNTAVSFDVGIIDLYFQKTFCQALENTVDEEGSLPMLWMDYIRKIQESLDPAVPSITTTTTANTNTVGVTMTSDTINSSSSATTTSQPEETNPAGSAAAAAAAAAEESTASSYAMRKKRKSGASNGPSQQSFDIPMQTFVRHRMDYDQTLLLSPLSIYEDGYLGSVPINTFFTPLPTTTTTPSSSSSSSSALYQCQQASNLYLPPEIHEMEDEVMEKNLMQSYAANYALQKKRLEQHIQDLHQYVQDSKLSYQKQEYIYQQTRQEDEAEKQRMKATLQQHGLLPGSRNTSGTIAENMTIQPILTSLSTLTTDMGSLRSEETSTSILSIEEAAMKVEDGAAQLPTSTEIMPPPLPAAPVTTSARGGKKTSKSLLANASASTTAAVSAIVNSIVSTVTGDCPTPADSEPSSSPPEPIVTTNTSSKANNKRKAATATAAAATTESIPSSQSSADGAGTTTSTTTNNKRRRSG